MCMVYSGGKIDPQHGRTVHRVSEDVEKTLGVKLGKNVQLFASSVDHNEHHLNNALERDSKFKEVLVEAMSDAHLVVFYERDAQIFLAGCRYYAEDPESKILRGTQYLALFQKAILLENGQKHDVQNMTIFRIPNSK